MSPELLPPARFGRARRPLPSPWRVGLEIIVASAVVGGAAGFVWWLLAPDVLVHVVDAGVTLDAYHGGRMFTRDAVFSLAAAVSGVLIALPGFLRHRRTPASALLALVLGGVAGSFVMLGVGRLLGPGPIEPRADDAAVGTWLDLPLDLEAMAAIMVWPIVSVIVVAVIAVFSDDRSPWAPPGERPQPMRPVESRSVS